MTDEERRLRVESLGAEELGRQYGLRKVDQLDAMAAADPHLFVDEKSDDDWIEFEGYAGDHLSDDQFFRMILAALDAAYPHEGAVWCIADGPMDHLVGRDYSFAARFHEERHRRVAVQAAFDAMHDDYKMMGLDSGWWSEP